MMYAVYLPSSKVYDMISILQEGDVLDAELEEDEVQIAKSGELSGEQLLSAHYLGVCFSNSKAPLLMSPNCCAVALRND